MITFEEGNILNDKYTMICHQVNTLGIMGAGLAKQIKNKYPEVFKEYKLMCENNQSGDLMKLGSEPVVVMCTINKIDKIVWNIFGQDRIDGPYPRTNYDALRKGFERIVDYWNTKLFDTHKLAIPYGIGCGLAGGDWDGVVYPMIQEVFKNYPDKVVIVKFNYRDIT